jgi:hypothetical protein
MDPQVTLATLVQDLKAFNRATANRQKSQQHKTLDAIEEAAENLRNWLAVGGFAPVLSDADKTLLSDFATGNGSADRLVRECLRLCAAAA